jgi:hypothetical protein
MKDEKFPIIAHGELYAESITKTSSGGPKKIPHEYETAKYNIIKDIDNVFQKIQEKQEIFLKEKIVCVRMEPKFEAKSYVPSQLIVDKAMDIVGGRKYSFTDDTEKEHSAKLYFLKTDDMGMYRLKETLLSGEKDRTELWRNQIGSIHSVDLLRPEEKVMGFPDNWDNGVVEIILHPLKNEYEVMLKLFYETTKIPMENTRVKSYGDGPTFISAKCSGVEIERLMRFNPLRAIHPLGEIDITPVRAFSGKAPTTSPLNKKSMITVGVFDGGVDNQIPLLKGHVHTNDCVTAIPDYDYLSHGTAVCGVVLHGDLAEKKETDSLPIPCVFVESYRVLPIQDKSDLELYEAIDAIENIVNSRKDIKLYNLSFGPQGAIVDDSINRFTYVLDQLTYAIADDEINPLFCVAVGNCGDLIEPLNRIQSPSDMVNGLGIGAYTYKTSGSKVRARYSCVGSGREGAKIKPDILDFGGDIARPFVLASLTAGDLVTSSGTSFSSPLIVNKIGKLMAFSENIKPHLARTLLIHNAIVDKDHNQKEQGHGFCLENVDDILNCEDKKVTILYSGVLKPTQVVRLPIFSPDINSVKGTVTISWTITTIVAPYLNDPDAYTNDCIEDVFYPHARKFNFSKNDPKTGKQKIKKLNIDDKVSVKALISQGYSQSQLPITYSRKNSLHEVDLRKREFKWDTVVKKQQRLHGASLLDPALTLRAIDRNGFNAQNIKYNVVISIEAPKYPKSLYDAILQEYPNLAPIDLRNIDRILVDTE